MASLPPLWTQAVTSLSPLGIFQNLHMDFFMIVQLTISPDTWWGIPCEPLVLVSQTLKSWFNLFLQQQIRGGIFKSKDTFSLERNGALVPVLHVNESALWLGGWAQGNYDLWIGYYVYLNTYVSQLQISTKLYKPRPLWLETAAKGRNQTHRDTWQKLSPGKL